MYLGQNKALSRCTRGKIALNGASINIKHQIGCFLEEFEIKLQKKKKCWRDLNFRANAAKSMVKSIHIFELFWKPCKEFKTYENGKPPLMSPLRYCTFNLARSENSNCFAVIPSQFNYHKFFSKRFRCTKTSIQYRLKKNFK